ncbi:unnamed protein product [Parnassius mnemosyne]|uniref:Reverse transcriptase domain-containing protein n=1 Tax=Parnassius mnemosyne TaxID=213953 RepID=A0AAV1L1N8_9NEOP
MVSFDVQSLFTCLPVEDCISIVTRKLAENNMPAEYAVLLRHCLTSGYLLWKEQFYKQVDGVAMGSPVSPIVADIFMEDFEEKALLTAPVTPSFYKREHEGSVTANTWPPSFSTSSRFCTTTSFGFRAYGTVTE